jgi:hypothetical protein
MPSSAVQAVVGFPAGKSVTCGDKETVTLSVKAIQNGPSSPGYKQFTYEFECKKCDAGKSSTKGNGQSSVPQSDVDQFVRVMFVVTNLDMIPRSVVNLNLASTLGWSITPSIPPVISLDVGESREFFLDVTVPGGTGAGAIDEITLTSAFEGVPESASADTVQILVAAIPTLTEWGIIIFGTLLLASVTFYIWRRRRLAFMEV